MRKLVLALLTSTLLINTGWSQTLFHYGDNIVTKEEFLRNYEKNIQNKKPDLSEHALRDYLDLYALFKMKVKEADVLKLDTLESIQRELDSYRKQLAKSYLTDEKVTNALVKEAYDRMKQDRKVAHILILASPNMSATDTMIIHNRMDSIYNALTKKKADFGTLAAMYSQDRGTKDNGGLIGYMTSLQTLYPFENAVYNTEVGKVSKPFRTAIGFHIVKVLDARPSRGEVEVAQILVATPKSKGEDGVKEAQLKVASIEKDLKSGASFDALVKKYSDDKYTKDNGGVMPPFGVGKMVPEFDEAAFALKKPGDISAPVRTDFGFHIIKLIRKIPLQPYDSMEPQIKKLVDNDSRAQTAKEAYFNKVKADNGFKEHYENFEELTDKMVANIADTGKNASTFKPQDYDYMNKVLFTLGGTNFTQKDFVEFAAKLTRGRIMGPKQGVIKDIYKMYVDRVVNDYQISRLEKDNVDFKNLMQEYRDGIMLFELMDEKVWGKASKDTVGLKEFYEANKNKYQWEPGFKGSVYRFKNEDFLKKGLQVFKKNSKATDEDLVKVLNTDTIPDAVTIQQGRYEFNHFTEVSKDKLIEGKLTNPVKNSDGTYTVVNVKQVFTTNSPKSLDDARGYVIAEYQDYLEKNWDALLRKKYPVKVDESVFKSMVK